MEDEEAAAAAEWSPESACGKVIEAMLVYVEIQRPFHHKI